MKNIVVMISCLSIFSIPACQVKAQNFSLQNLYMHVKTGINPALTGWDGNTNYTLCTRIQWVGIQDAPQTFAANFSTRLLNSKLPKFLEKRTRNSKREYGNIGLGGLYIHDQSGALQQNTIQFNYAYHINFEYQEQLSFGLSLHLNYFNLRMDQLHPYYIDSYIQEKKYSKLFPDFNFGIQYIAEKTKFGCSIQNILQQVPFLKVGKVYPPTKSRIYYLSSSYRYAVSQDFILEPEIQTGFKVSSLYHYDFICKLHYSQTFILGIVYQSDEAMTLLMGLKHKNLLIGYAYEYSLRAIRTINYGTHELTLTLRFCKNPRKYEWFKNL